MTGKLILNKYYNWLNNHINFLYRYPVHRSKSVMQFVAETKNILFVDWPKYFGDLMPVETVWMQMSNNFATENLKATNEESLWREVSTMWEKVCTDDFIDQLFQDFPMKLKKIEQFGGLSYVD